MEKEAISISPENILQEIPEGQDVSVLMNGCHDKVDHSTWCTVRRSGNVLKIISKELINMGRKTSAFWKEIDQGVFQKNVAVIFTDAGPRMNPVGAGQLVQNHNCYEGAL